MKITVLSKNNCMQCEFTKKFLNDNNLEFEEINVEEDSGAMEYAKLLGFTSMPVVLVDGMDPWGGFRPDELMKLVKR